jgi:arylsulfatase A-like enzyme
VSISNRYVVLGLLLLLSAGCAQAPGPRPERVLLISIDTCRADHLSVYGYPRETAPTMERLAAEGVVFEHAFAQVPDTTPSHASLFTSRYPFVHGSANGVPLRDEFVTLAEMLGENGKATAAIVSGYTMTAADSGLDQGFTVYDDTLTRRGTPTSRNLNERPAEETADRALAWLDENADESFFLFVHFFDPHGVYQPPEPYDRMFENESGEQLLLPIERIPPYARIGDETDANVYISRYDGEIRYVDDQIGRLVEALDEHGILDDTLLVVTADHGESLTEHGFFFAHGWRLFEPSMRVPLLFRYPPGLPGGLRVDGIAQSIDVLPTLLELLGIDAPAQIDGISLMPLIDGSEPSLNPYALAKTTKSLTYLNLELDRDLHDHYAIRTPEWKYLHGEDGISHMLFDLVRDPEERQNVASTDAARVAELRELLLDALESHQVDASEFLQPLDDDERQRLEERLRSLGYVQ